MTDDVLRHRALGHFNSQLEQFAVYPGRSPSVDWPDSSCGLDLGSLGVQLVGRSELGFSKSNRGRKPLRCQAMTVSGFTIRRAERQPGPKAGEPYPEGAVCRTEFEPLLSVCAP